jgi:plastocyanin
MHTSGLVISRRRIVTAALLAVPLAGLGRLVLTDDVQAADIAVDIGSFQFNPSPITISAGTTVVWTNRDTVPHTATSDTKGLFDTGRLQYGKSGKVTFNDAGTFTYYCAVHPFMHGTVIVTATGATTNTTPASNFVRRLGDG